MGVLEHSSQKREDLGRAGAWVGGRGCSISTCRFVQGRGLGRWKRMWDKYLTKATQQSQKSNAATHLYRQEGGCRSDRWKATELFIHVTNINWAFTVYSPCVAVGIL